MECWGKSINTVSPLTTIPTPRAQMTKSKNVYRLALCAMLFALCCPVHAQQQGKVFRIGYLSSQSHSADAARLNGFRQVLHDLGYVEGKNIVIDIDLQRESLIAFPTSQLTW